MSHRHSVLVFLSLVFAASALAQRPNVNVQRKDAPTPEISSSAPNELQPGQTVTIVMHGKNFLADAHDAHADGQCRLNSFKFVSLSEIQFNVTAEKLDDGGTCEVQVRMGNRYVNNSVAVAMTALGRQHRQERERQEQAEQQKRDQEQQQKMKDMVSHARDIVGKKWDVKFPNGKTDTWTFSSNNYSMFEFKNGKSQTLMVVIGENDELVIQPAEGCMFTGKIAGGKVTNGESPLPGCSLGNGAWSATISK